MTDAPAMALHPYGPSAWMLDDVADPAGMAAGIVSASLAGVHEVVPAESTVLVVCDRSRTAAIGASLGSIGPTRIVADETDVFTIEVVYDGADLSEVADATGLTVAEVIERHVAGDYRVEFCGFSPGFGYLSGLDPVLHLPRRGTPRTRVPAGAVAIGAGYSAVYPTASPGGWHLIGTTAATLWDTDADPPATMRPGRPVRFRRVLT